MAKTPSKAAAKTEPGQHRPLPPPLPRPNVAAMRAAALVKPAHKAGSPPPPGDADGKPVQRSRAGLDTPKGAPLPRHSHPTERGN
jgi:hypothetical protein